VPQSEMWALFHPERESRDMGRVSDVRDARVRAGGPPTVRGRGRGPRDRPPAQAGAEGRPRGPRSPAGRHRRLFRRLSHAPARAFSPRPTETQPGPPLHLQLTDPCWEARLKRPRCQLPLSSRHRVRRWDAQSAHGNQASVADRGFPSPLDQLDLSQVRPRVSKPHAPRALSDLPQLRQRPARARRGAPRPGQARGPRAAPAAPRST
jgi:hypothetical protein